MMKKHILTALVIVSAVTLAGCSSKKKETEAPAPETQAAAAVQTEATAVETEVAAAVETEAAAAAVETEAAAAETESEDEMESFIDALDGETEEDFWETEDEYGFWETESEYEYFFDETETEAEIIPRPEYNVSDYLKIDDDEYLNVFEQTGTCPERISLVPVDLVKCLTDSDTSALKLYMD